MPSESELPIQPNRVRSNWLDQLVESDSVAATTSLAEFDSGSLAGVDQQPKFEMVDAYPDTKPAVDTTFAMTKARLQKIFFALIVFVASLEAILLWSGWGQERPHSRIARIQNAIASESALKLKTLDMQKLGGVTFVVSSNGDADYSTINEALAAASDGDRVLVKPGTYRENVTLEKSVTIEGIGKRDFVRIESSSGSVMSLKSKRPIIQGLTIAFTGKNDELIHAIDVRSGNPTLENCEVSSTDGICLFANGASTNVVVRNCRFQNATGSGIFLRTGTKAEIVESSFENMKFVSVSLDEESSAIVRNSRFEGGRTGIESNNAELNVSNSSFSDYRQAIQIAKNSKAILQTSSISKSKEMGVSLTGSSTLNATGLKISDSENAAIMLSNSSCEISRSEIARCKSAILVSESQFACDELVVDEAIDHGLTCVKSSRATLSNSRFRNCKVAWIASDESQLVGSGCDLSRSKKFEVSVIDTSNVVLNNCELHSGDFGAAECRDNATLTLNRCRVNNAAKLGFWGNGNGRSCFIACEFEKSERALLMQGEHQSSILGGSIQACTAGIDSFAASQLNCREMRIDSCSLGVQLRGKLPQHFSRVHFANNRVAVSAVGEGNAELFDCVSAGSTEKDWKQFEGGTLTGARNSPELDATSTPLKP